MVLSSQTECDFPLGGFPSGRIVIRGTVATLTPYSGIRTVGLDPGRRPRALSIRHDRGDVHRAGSDQCLVPRPGALFRAAATFAGLLASRRKTVQPAWSS